MAEFVHLAQSFMNVEDAIIAKKMKRAVLSSGRSQHYTTLNVPLDQVLMQINDDPSLQWLEKMKGDPNKCTKNKYCRFHRNHRHDTDKCYDLKQQIENLISQGKLRNFLG